MSTAEVSLMASNHKLESDAEHYNPRPQRPPPPPPSKPVSPIHRMEQAHLYPELEKSLPLEEQTDEHVNNTERDQPSLLSEFQRLFDNFNYESIRDDILNRKLIECNFTTVLWRIFLHCLPRDSNQWDEILETSRINYEKLVGQYTIDPYKTGEDNHVAQHVNHPLSRDETSSWAQYFSNEELKRTIIIDVQRTCPDILYFRDPRIIDLQLRILFTHSRRHQQTTPYRQGMHEILGIIIYAMHTESLKINEDPEANELMKIIYDPEYLEHDAYILFEKIMDHLRQFYALSTNSAVPRKPANPRETKQIPFQKLRDVHIPANETAQRMNSIVDRLKAHDPVLYSKLEELKIEPTVYGIRWLRVLFGREIPFDSIPNLWTVIFCFDEHFGFVEYFFIALLMEIGRLIAKQGDIPHSHYLQSLMKQNIITNVEPVIRKGLNLSGKELPILPEEPVTLPQTKGDRFPQNSAEDGEKNPPKIQRVHLIRTFEPRPNRQAQKSTSNHQSDSRKYGSSNDISLSKVLKPSSAYIAQDPETDFLTEKTTGQRYADNIQLQQSCALYMNKFIERLQTQIVTLNLPNEDELHLSLSGLKQIANVLDHKLTFDNQSLQAIADYKPKDKKIETNSSKDSELS